ncbi:hypothetical protein CH063_05375 [Colletotrichum higginsianum]|uniref:Uncharacterized protein n=1 Tax=Colletotrichum higginsianum (strain IMI 349063) TaxID=759273 RepID=H1UYS2_COLHI|nr:hypothetical protein CH063_05375 [Colletotrichum higginsianum]
MERCQHKAVALLRGVLLGRESEEFFRLYYHVKFINVTVKWQYVDESPGANRKSDGVFDTSPFISTNTDARLLPYTLTGNGRLICALPLSYWSPPPSGGSNVIGVGVGSTKLGRCVEMQAVGVVVVVVVVVDVVVDVVVVVVAIVVDSVVDVDVLEEERVVVKVVDAVDDDVDVVVCEFVWAVDAVDDEEVVWMVELGKKEKDWEVDVVRLVWETLLVIGGGGGVELGVELEDHHPRSLTSIGEDQNRYAAQRARREGDVDLTVGGVLAEARSSVGNGRVREPQDSVSVRPERRRDGARRRGPAVAERLEGLAGVEEGLASGEDLIFGEHEDGCDAADLRVLVGPRAHESAEVVSLPYPSGRGRDRGDEEDHLPDGERAGGRARA